MVQEVIEQEQDQKRVAYKDMHTFLVGCPPSSLMSKEDVKEEVEDSVVRDVSSKQLKEIDIDPDDLDTVEV